MNIQMQRGALSSSRELIAHLPDLHERCAIVTDHTVASLYAEKIAAWLKAAKHEALVISFPPGERSKTRMTKQRIEDQLFAHGWGKDTSLLAIGGGAVTDVGGFVAATFARGIPLYLVPTTLVCMVDAAIGGKNGVNVRWGKNLIGTYLQPRKVVIDPAVLETLPPKEFKNGLVEMIKHALIASAKYFEFLEAHVDDIENPEVLDHAISESCRIKMEIVREDECEQGKRHLLNFGHTFAHAFETVTRYKISHGQAVCLGILAEAYMALRLEIMPERVFDRIFQIFDSYKLLSLTKVPPQKLFDAMMLDKKSLKGLPRFILLEEIGKPRGLYHVDKSLIFEAVDWINNVMRL